jgi:drug/metabolite transporter (DMT)-like permease
MPATPRLKAFAALGLGVVSISWSAIFVRWAAMPGIASAFYRVLIASSVLWLLLLARRPFRLPVPRRIVLLSALGGLFFAGDLAGYNIAVLHTSAGNATFLGNNAPLVVGLLSWRLTRRRPSSRFWIALAIASTGALCIVSSDLGRSSASADALAIFASVCFALYLLVTERVRGLLDTLTLSTLSATACAVSLLALSAATRTSLAVPHLSSLAALVGLGLVCQLAGYFSLTYALGHLPATVSSVTVLAVAPLSALLAYWLFHEPMTPLQLSGGAFILAAVWVVSREPLLHPNSEAVSQPSGT